MASVVFSAGIDSVSGALSKPSKSGQHSCNKMLLATHRVAASSNPNCNRLFIRKPVKRSTEPTQLELAARTRFTAVQAAVNTRMKNLSTIAADREAFEAQKDLAGGKTTLKSYLWKVCGDTYDAQNG
ncbi:MAG: hypothetical protein IK073_05965 [Paludibacteraceae bacterium]|nr:hypothetical protein [Paludibacteraceae bacterium]